MDQPRDLRSGTTQNRRSVKDDSDLWANVRQSRPSTLEDDDRPYRKNGDRAPDQDREGGRGLRTSRGFENHRRDGERGGGHGGIAKRDGTGRGRNEPSWSREDPHPEDEEADSRDATKSKDRRERDGRGTRGSAFEWNRAPKTESAPEWMGASEPDADTPTHTQEDLDQWYAKMKAGGNGKPDNPVDRPPGHDRNISATGTSHTKAKVDKPLIFDSTVDGFYGLLSDAKSKEIASNSGNGTNGNRTDTGSKPMKASKFTGFFNPKPDAEPPKENVSVPSAPPATLSQEDKEGFDRVLMLLGKQQQSLDIKSLENRPSQQQRRWEPPSSPPSGSRAVEENGYSQGPLGLNAQAGNVISQDKERDFLFSLQQRPQETPTNQNQPSLLSRQSHRDSPAELLPFPNLMVSPHDTPQQLPSRGPPPGHLDEVQARDKLNPGAERRGPPPGLSNENVPRPTPIGPPPSIYPTGVPRPPGLDNLPPGYQQILPHRHNMAPPPGFPAPPRNQNPIPPGYTLNDRAPFSTPATGRGMASPPFMQPPPPPGFPMPFNREGLPFGGFADGAQFGQGFPQQRRQ